MKAAMGFGVGLLAAAGGVSWWLVSSRAPAPPPVVIVQAPPPPPAALIPAPIQVEQPAPVVRQVARRQAPKVAASPAPMPAPEPMKSPPQPVTVTNAQPAPSPQPRSPELPPPPPKVEPRVPRNATIPAGTLITVRLNQAISSEGNQEGETFSVVLDQPLVINGLILAERGSRQRGRIVGLDRAGRVKGRASFGLVLDRLTTTDGQEIEILTETFTHEAESGMKGDVAKTGVAAGIGAAIGAIAGGGKGAGIGAAVGGAVGAGSVLATRGKEARLPAETRISFRLSQPVTLTEKLN